IKVTGSYTKGTRPGQATATPTPAQAPAPTGGATSFQAETAIVGGGSTPTGNAVRFGGAGSVVEFNVGTTSGTRTLSFVYSNSSNSSVSATVTLNGQSIGTLNFAPTGGAFKSVSLSANLGPTAPYKGLRVTVNGNGSAVLLDRVDIQ